MNRKMDINKLSSSVIKAAINVHTERGPGLLESVYQACMEIELKEMNLKTKTEVPIPIIFRGREITDQGLKKLCVSACPVGALHRTGVRGRFLFYEE